MPWCDAMLVLLTYDTPETRDQTFLRTEFLRLGGERVQYSLYLFSGEPHECDRVIRYMRRAAAGIPGDIRLLPMDESTWNRQFVISEVEETARKIREIDQCVLIW
jgi:CRISPR-associated endonuclease Cas2